VSTSYTIKSDDVPIGVYKAKFLGDEPTVHPEFGAGIRFKFEVVDGKCAGKVVTRITGSAPRPKNAAGKFLAMIAGVKPSDGVTVSPADFVGQKYVITVGETDSGYTRVNEVMPETDTPF
jgi:hypothetical protein